MGFVGSDVVFMDMYGDLFTYTFSAVFKSFIVQYDEDCEVIPWSEDAQSFFDNAQFVGVL